MIYSSMSDWITSNIIFKVIRTILMKDSSNEVVFDVFCVNWGRKEMTNGDGGLCYGVQFKLQSNALLKSDD